jgi:UPF0755 protein
MANNVVFWLKWLKILLWVGVATVVTLGAIGAYYWVQFQKPVELPSGRDSVEFAVGTRMSLSAAVDKLAEKGIIANAEAAQVFVRLYARLTNKGMQSGVYLFTKTMTQADALLRLFSPATTETVSVTFQEGISIKRFAELAAEKIGCNQAEFLMLAYSDSLRKARNITSPSLEGYLLPNTYEFFKHSSPELVLNRLLDEHEQCWASLKGDSLAKALKLSKHEVLTLASIVEAETPVDAEKPRVAGVYWNRLNIQMKLEADPTVQYALDRVNPNRESRRLLYKDLEIDSPYNTYKYTGLPPTPINSPGKAAIAAALNPEAHKYIYFVATMDGTNTHTFTRTADEHLRAVALFRARRAKIKAELRQ